eukprot:scaffold998_cov411-Prasinococcus_capsulatus_cf.AAC.22
MGPLSPVLPKLWTVSTGTRSLEVAGRDEDGSPMAHCIARTCKCVYGATVYVSLRARAQAPYGHGVCAMKSHPMDRGEARG